MQDLEIFFFLLLKLPGVIWLPEGCHGLDQGALCPNPPPQHHLGLFQAAAMAMQRLPPTLLLSTGAAAMPAPKPAWASTKADICPALLQSMAAVVLVRPKAAQGVPGCGQQVCPAGQAVSWGTRSRGHQGMLSEGSPCAVSQEELGGSGLELSGWGLHPLQAGTSVPKARRIWGWLEALVANRQLLCQPCSSPAPPGPRTLCLAPIKHHGLRSPSGGSRDKRPGQPELRGSPARQNAGKVLQRQDTAHCHPMCPA